MTNINNPNDWLQITIKFRGKCCECGKQMTSGEALWSKSTKAIKHIDCYLRKINNQPNSYATTSLKESTTPDQEKKGFDQQRKSIQQTTELKCFICGNKTTFSNDEIDPINHDDYKSKSRHAFICESCLKREDAYEAYQQSFLQRINKYLK